MLFDLRGRGRRRTVQTIYVALALLMGGGLVLFGIGGATSGGLLDAFSGGGGGGNNTFEKRVETAQKTVKTHPQSEQAWAALAKARYLLASSGSNYDQTSGTFTGSGRAELRQATNAWEHYLSMNPAKPDPGVAAYMVQAYGTVLNQPAKAVNAQEIVVDSQAPSSGQYATLAILAYRAGQVRKGDLSTQKALSLEKDPTRRKEYRAQLKAAKAQATGAASGGTTTGTATTPSG